MEFNCEWPLPLLTHPLSPTFVATYQPTPYPSVQPTPAHHNSTFTSPVIKLTGPPLNTPLAVFQNCNSHVSENAIEEFPCKASPPKKNTKTVLLKLDQKAMLYVSIYKCLNENFTMKAAVWNVTELVSEHISKFTHGLDKGEQKKLSKTLYGRFCTFCQPYAKHPLQRLKLKGPDWEKNVRFYSTQTNLDLSILAEPIRNDIRKLHSNYINQHNCPEDPIEI